MVWLLIDFVFRIVNGEIYLKDGSLSWGNWKFPNDLVDL